MDIFDQCEWNPDTNNFAKTGEHLVVAEYICGKDGYRLCENCSNLSKFKRMKKKRIDRNDRLYFHLNE